MTSNPAFAANVHVSQHPCLRAKLSQLRSKSCDAKATKALVHEIASILAGEALATSLSLVTDGQVGVARRLHAPRGADSGQDETPLGYAYDVKTVSPARISLVPILRSGLAMVDGTWPPWCIALAPVMVAPGSRRCRRPC